LVQAAKISAGQKGENDVGGIERVKEAGKVPTIMQAVGRVTATVHLSLKKGKKKSQPKLGGEVPVVRLLTGKKNTLRSPREQS